MKTNIIDTKCPYCKTIFKTSAFGSSWAQCLWGQYAPEEIAYTCPDCNQESIVSVSCNYRYSAKKKKVTK